MKLIAIFAMVLAFFCWQPKAAFAQESIRELVKTLVTPSNVETMKGSIRSGLTRVYIRYLSGQSVTVLDREEFAQLIPAQNVEPWIAFGLNQIERCFERLPTQDIKQILEHQQYLEGLKRDTSSQLRSAEMYKLTELEMKRRGFQPLEYPMLGCYITIDVLSSDVSGAASVKPGDDVSFLADILEVEGIARFPNRIIKNDLLANLRKTARK